MYTVKQLLKTSWFNSKTARPLLAGCLLAVLPVTEAEANCTATMGNINFGNVDLVNSGSLTTQANVTITCTNTSSIAQNFNVCLAIDGGKAAASPTQMNPRYMCPNGTCADPADRFAFNLYTDANFNTIWGTPIYTNANTINTIITTPPSSSQSKTLTVYGKIIEPFSQVAPGTYLNNFFEGSTAVGYSTTSSNTPQACSRLQAVRFPFTVSATVTKGCKVDTPQNIDFGTVTPEATDLRGTTALNVTCSRSTPYSIGLQPSNGNLNGAGQMSAVLAGGNTNSIPYQLRSTSSIYGTTWGNIVNANTVSNGVAGTGTGSVQTIPVYATISAANASAGEYRDKVTVQVNY